MKNIGLYSVMVFVFALILYSFDMWNYAIITMLAFTNAILVEIYKELTKSK